jgi:DNA topoisomerase I
MNNIVVVESPSKTKKLESFLGSEYKVISSVGHIRDLPKSKLSVDVEHEFEPVYVISEDKEDVVKTLKKAAQQADTIYLATDPDREGEAIAWHVGFVMNKESELKNDKESKFLLANKVKNKSGKSPEVYRVSFNSITKEAVLEAFKNPRKLDTNLVDAQQARRILDRLVGYKLSPLLWQKIRYGLSAGRVQSVAVRLIAEREKEINGFPKEPYYEVKSNFTQSGNNHEVPALLVSIDGKSIYEKVKFDLFAGEYTASKTKIDSKDKLTSITKDLENDKFILDEVSDKESKSHPSPPFSTSTLQQAASARLGYSPSRTMQFAQKLYEAGHITYMRTDSFNIVPTALKEIRATVRTMFGVQYLSKIEKHYKGKKESRTQEAHEAIRPTHANLKPSDLPKSTNPQQLKLYELIWARTLASQMSPAVFSNTTFKILNTIADTKYLFESKGSVIKFEGYLKVYPNSKKDIILPAIKAKEPMDLKKLDTVENTLTPPPRYNESSLVKELEKFGIGRPSTYASIISTIQTRGYVKKDEKVLYPTDNGIIVNNLLVEHFKQIVDVDFTAQMEEDLDLVAEGQLKWTKILKEFYEPFDRLISQKQKEIKKEDIVNMEKTDELCPECQKGHLMIKLGKYGKFLSCDAYPECKYARPLETEGEENSQEKTEEFINSLSEEDRAILSSACPSCGGKILLKQGRYGKFLACDTYPKCKFTKSIQNKLDIICPKCGATEQGKVVVKRTKKGKTFYGCSRYPQCDFSSWTMPKNKAES